MVAAIVISHLVQRGKQIKLVEMAAAERAFHRSLTELDMMAMITMIMMLMVMVVVMMMLMMLMVMMMLMKMAGNSIDLRGSN